MRLDPSLPEAWYNRGLLFKAEGRHNAAVADFTEALSRRPGYVLALFQRGVSYRLLEKPDLALADFDEALRREPSHFHSLVSRALLLENSDPARALRDYERALQVCPADWPQRSALERKMASLRK